MPPEARLVLGLALASALVYSATPLAIRMADRFQFYDKPAGYKGHGRPTPYLGGAAVMAGFLLALAAVSTDGGGRTWPLVAGIAVLWAVGTIDDRHNISWAVRVVVEVGLAAMLWVTGLGWDLGLGDIPDLLLTILWVVAVVNAFNLFDNMDGAASTMALVVSGGVVAMAVVHDDTWLAIAAATLCGACIGFLPHNLSSPARIFLGDGGSMPIGFAVAALVMTGSAEAAPAWQALVVGLLLVGVPALDTTLVMVSRRRRGISILTGGRDHLTHRAQRRLRTARAVAMALGAVQALVSALALFAVRGGAAAVVLIVVLYLVAAATAIALLEAAEREEAAANVALSPGTAVAPGPPRVRVRPWAPVSMVVALGVALGVSPFAGGWYDEDVWMPVGLGLVCLTTAAAIARPPHLSRPALLTLGGLLALAVWALVSASWAPSIVQATTEGNRLFVLAAILATALVLVRTEASGAWLAGGLAAGIGIVAAYVVVRLLGPDPNALFVGGRINQPLGYINGQATVFIMGFWLCFALAERRTVWLAGLGAGAATVMVCLALLSESRGAALAMVASLAAVVAFVPGSRPRRIFGIAACGLGLAVAVGPLLELYDTGLVGPVTPAAGHRAGLAILAAGALAGLLWAGSVFAAGRLEALRPSAHGSLRRAAVAGLAAAVLVAGGAAVASGDRIQRDASAQWDAFVTLSMKPGSTPSDARSRLAAGGGTRYDYWRIAWEAFADKPLRGVGAGNYDRPYFRARQTLEAVRQPHSLPLQVLSELGIVGGAMLLCVVGGLAWGAARMRRAAAASPRTATLMVAGVGAVSAWLVHTSVDWMHLMPGITGIALAMGTVLLLRRRPAEAPAAAPVAVPVPRRRRPVALAGAGLAGLVLVVAVGSLSRQGLAELFRDRAQSALADRPADALREAERSLRLDAENPRTYYVKAAALARFNEADAAERTLREALRREPDDFVTWTLLGDLAIRRGRYDEAQRNYEQAEALNPRDPTLQALANDPRKALGEEAP